jgi:glycosyltransferase involved in cell wall biosynthesis
MSLRDKISEKLNYYAKGVYARYMGQLSNFKKGIAAANASNWDEYSRINVSSVKPGPSLPISAIMRVRNAEISLMISVESIENYCSEIVLVDHNSTDETRNIMNILVSKYPGRVKIYRYEKSAAKAGVGYIERVNAGGGSLAEYYNFCFSLGTQEYLLKWDADMVALPSFYTYCKAGIEKNRDIVYFDGVDLMGVFSCANEGRLFKRSLKWEFRDFAYCEGLVIDGKPLTEASLSRYSAIVPAYFHLRQLV